MKVSLCWLALLALFCSFSLLSAAAETADAKKDKGNWLSSLKGKFMNLMKKDEPQSKATTETNEKIAVPEVPSMSDEQAEIHILKAAEHLQKNDLTTAVDELVQIISAKPDHLEAHSVLGGVLLALQQFDIAETILYSALRLSQWTDQPSIVNLANVFAQNNETTLAIKTLLKGYNTTRAAGGDLKVLAAALGDAYAQSGDFSAASDWYFSAATAALTDTDLWLKASTLKFPIAAQKQDVAESVLVTALGHKRDSPALLYWLGRVEMTKGRLEESIVFFQQALRLDESFSDAVMALATAHHSLGQSEQALHYYNIALQRQPNNITLLVNCALLLNSLQRQNDSLRLMNIAYSLDAQHVEVLRAMQTMNLVVEKQ